MNTFEMFLFRVLILIMINASATENLYSAPISPVYTQCAQHINEIK